MKILCLDSATESATAAIIDENKLLGEIIFNYKKQHSVIMMPMIDKLLKNTDLDINDIDGFVVSKGPGSFTGLRIGMATIKGLVQANEKPFISISSLDALANNLYFAQGIICPIMDALRGNVYTNFYKMEDGSLTSLEDPQILSLDELIGKVKSFNDRVYFIGDGTYKFSEELLNNLNNISFAPSHLNIVRASSLGELGMQLLKKGIKEDIFTSAPIYLRASQAEREYEEKMRKNNG
jgi:tRNA threonylcarbamoyladenosine biosynthesis protein TsaB